MTLLPKFYPCRADLLEQWSEQDKETGQVMRSWFFIRSIDCNVVDVQPSSHLEEFGEKYHRSRLIKVETPDRAINLSQRITNVRTKGDGQQVFPIYDNIDEGEEFNINAVSTQVDLFGGIVCSVLFCEFSSS